MNRDIRKHLNKLGNLNILSITKIMSNLGVLKRYNQNTGQE